jgi:hypothetical protein
MAWWGWFLLGVFFGAGALVLLRRYERWLWHQWESNHDR